MTAKKRAVLVGGKPHNVPKELHRYFELVDHIHQDEKPRAIRRGEVDIVLIIRDWVNHGHVRGIQAMLPGVPIVAARAGWSHMATELVRRGLLPEPEPEPKEAPPPSFDAGQNEPPPPPLPSISEIEAVKGGVPISVADAIKKVEDMAAERSLLVERITYLEDEIAEIRGEIDQRKADLAKVDAMTSKFSVVIEKYKALQEEIAKVFGGVGS